MDDMAEGDVSEELLELERAGWDSLCDGSGSGFYGTVMTKDAVMVLANGVVLDRGAVVEALREAPPWRTYELSEARVIDVGAAGRALSYTGTAYREAEEPAFVALMTSVYTRGEDGWRLAVYQQTPVPG